MIGTDRNRVSNRLTLRSIWLVCSDCSAETPRIPFDGSDWAMEYHRLELLRAHEWHSTVRGCYRVELCPQCVGSTPEGETPQ